LKTAKLSFWITKCANSGGNAGSGIGLRPLACWDCGFESWSCECRVLYRYRSLRRADPSSRGALPSVYVSLNVIRCNSNTLHLEWVGRKRSNWKGYALLELRNK
jgi:hypothetical protein